MTDGYIQWSNYSTFFLKYAHFERERERERERWNVRVYVPTNNKTVNLVLLQKHVVDEKYNVAIQYGNYFITIKVAG